MKREYEQGYGVGIRENNFTVARADCSLNESYAICIQVKR